MTAVTTPPPGAGSRRDERLLSAAMLGCFFLIITSFWVMKPLKKALFVERYDAGGLELFGAVLRASQAELLAKVLNLAVAFAAMVAFTWLSRRLRRERLGAVLTAFFLFGFAAFGLVLDAGGAGSVWSFYLFGDLFSTVMVAGFFAFLADSVDAAQARRLYGPIGVGGVAGGVFGSLVVRSWIGALPVQAWMWVLLALGLGILLTASAAGRLARRLRDLPAAPAPDPSGTGRASAVTEGARLVLRSRYLLAIAAIVGLYEVISALIDFQFTETVARCLDGPAIGRHFSTVYLVTNTAALVIQILVTGAVLRRFGVGVALLALPLVVLAGSAGFLAVPALLAASFLSIGDNALNYSIHQSAREALWVPTAPEEKYRAKACVDMVVQRGAKTVGVLLGLGLSAAVSGFAGLRAVSLVVAALVAVWIVAARYAGRRFARREADETAARAGLGEARPLGAEVLPG
jgi:AAA family ATP:ADP antiporter